MENNALNETSNVRRTVAINSTAEAMRVVLLSLNCTSSLIYLASALLNTLGVYLLAATEPFNNSKIILVNLAATEIVISVMQIVDNLMRLFSAVGEGSLTRKLENATWLFYFFAMYFLTVDRLVRAAFPLRYVVMITKKRIRLAVLATWFLALVFAIPLVLVDACYVFFISYMPLTLDIIFIILCLATYGLILTKLIQRRRLSHNQQDVNSGRRLRILRTSNRKFLKVVAFIILSFLFFILLPDIIFHIYPANSQEVFESLKVVWAIALVVDPIIYIFLQDELRLLLIKKLRKVARRNEEPNHQDTAL